MNLKTKYDVVFVLGGGIKKDGEMWRTANLDEGDNFGPTGDRLRVIAAELVFKQGETNLLFVSGGRGQYEDSQDAPTLASVLKRELIMLGIPEQAIKTEGESGNTYQQLKAIGVIVEKEGFNYIGILSGRFHLPRISAMLNFAPDLKNLSQKSTLISAEEKVLQLGPPEWKPLIEKVYKSEGMKKRIKLEQKGVREIEEGRYKFN